MDCMGGSGEEYTCSKNQFLCEIHTILNEAGRGVGLPRGRRPRLFKLANPCRRQPHPHPCTNSMTNTIKGPQPLLATSTTRTCVSTRFPITSAMNPHSSQQNKYLLVRLGYVRGILVYYVLPTPCRCHFGQIIKANSRNK